MAQVMADRRSLKGPRRDAQGNRSYVVEHVVKVDPDTEGGYDALQAAGLPQPGDDLNFDNEKDPWAFCSPEADVSPLEEKDGERPEFYVVQQTFSTRPAPKCNDQQVQDPLFEPMKVRGSFKNRREESSFDRFGRPIVTSSWELIRGKENEWDVCTASVSIEQNVPILELDLCTWMQNRVNMFTLWGLPPRCVKLSGFDWEPKYYGRCYVYYTRRFEFEIDFRTFDRYILDEGTKALRGKWVAAATSTSPPVYKLDKEPSRFRPADFVRYTDPYGNPGKVVLNGYGLPSGVCIDYEGDTNAETEAPIRYFVCVPYDDAPSVRGARLLDWDNWVQLAAGNTSSLVDAENFYFATRYIRGNLVSWQGQVYVCTSDSYLELPHESYNWRILTLGLNDQGVWDVSTTYLLGDVVAEAAGLPTTGTGTDQYRNCRETPVGYRFVQKYFEADFTVLGIPLFF